jgi:hypothetical protein
MRYALALALLATCAAPRPVQEVVPETEAPPPPGDESIAPVRTPIGPPPCPISQVMGTGPDGKPVPVRPGMAVVLDYRTATRLNRCLADYRAGWEAQIAEGPR